MNAKSNGILNIFVPVQRSVQTVLRTTCLKIECTKKLDQTYYEQVFQERRTKASGQHSFPRQRTGVGRSGHLFYSTVVQRLYSSVFRSRAVPYYTTARELDSSEVFFLTIRTQRLEYRLVNDSHVSRISGYQT